MAGELIFFRRGEELMRVLLDRPRTVIGRGDGVDVAVPHPEVSRRQAAIERSDAGFRLRDLSGRGTNVGGTETVEALLQDGVELSLGDFRAVFRNEAQVTLPETLIGRELTEQVHGAPRVPEAAGLRLGARTPQPLVPIGDELTIGKDVGCTIVLTDGFASGVHCRLQRVGAGVRLFDLASTNGTYVNGVRVGQADLALGDRLRIGESELTLEVGEEARAASFEGILSEEHAMREVFDLIDRVAPANVPVAIFGETGTGKELVAAALHTRSDRAKGPFIPVNCAAISRELVESELFGHEKGAFTGAAGARKGAFEEASGGTIFLDEIGELSVDLQAKLLRTLELGEIRRVGSSRPFRVDARIVCATHRDLRAAVKKGSFREDLYYRLCVIRVELPPLRRRPADVPLLVSHFTRALAPRGTRPALEPRAMEKLSAHTWPGNIRELKNVLARAMLLRKGPVVTAGDIVFDGGEVPPERLHYEATDDNDQLILPGKTLAEIEAEATRKCLLRHGGNRRAAARELDVARSTMQKRAAQLGVPPPSGAEETEEASD